LDAAGVVAPHDRQVTFGQEIIGKGKDRRAAVPGIVDPARRRAYGHGHAPLKRNRPRMARPVGGLNGCVGTARRSDRDSRREIEDEPRVAGRPPWRRTKRRRLWVTSGLTSRPPSARRAVGPPLPRPQLRYRLVGFGTGRYPSQTPRSRSKSTFVKTVGSS